MLLHLSLIICYCGRWCLGWGMILCIVGVWGRLFLCWFCRWLFAWCWCCGCISVFFGGHDVSTVLCVWLVSVLDPEQLVFPVVTSRAWDPTAHSLRFNPNTRCNPSITFEATRSIPMSTPPVVQHFSLLKPWQFQPEVSEQRSCVPLFSTKLLDCSDVMRKSSLLLFNEFSFATACLPHYAATSTTTNELFATGSTTNRGLQHHPQPPQLPKLTRKWMERRRRSGVTQKNQKMR